MSTEDAKKYLSKREIPQLFESMMTGLMYYRPDDHVTYLQDCLDKIKADGVDKIRWNLFIEQRQKTPLPPIPSSGNENGRTQPVLNREPTDLRASRTSPLPPIGQTGSGPRGGDAAQPKQPPIVFITGGPGGEQTSIARSLVRKYHGWVHLSAELLVQKAAQRTNVDPNQVMISDDEQNLKFKIDVIESALSSNPGVTGVILDGFPMSLPEAQIFQQRLGKCVHAFIIDCESDTLEKRMKTTSASPTFITSRINDFKSRTLPMIKLFDDRGKLTIIEGERQENVIVDELAEKFDQLLSGKRPDRNFSPVVASVPASPRPPSSPRQHSRQNSRPGSSRYKRPTSGLLRQAGRINVDVPDSGRQANMPQCPILIMFGGPGSRRGKLCTMIEQNYPGVVCVPLGALLREKTELNSSDSGWDVVRRAMTSGNMVEDHTVNELLSTTMTQFRSARAVVITGYPRNKKQIEYLHTTVGGITSAFVVDCEESTLMENLAQESRTSERSDNGPETIEARMDYFKTHTLPVIGHYDDQGQLFVVNGERHSSEVFVDIQNILSPLLSSTTSASGALFNDVPGTITVSADEQDVTIPIISVIGGPNSGVSDIASRLADEHSGVVCISKSSSSSMIDQISSSQSNNDLCVIIAENFPASKDDVELVNSKVGKIERVILVDHSPMKLQKDLQLDQQEEFETYRMETLPMLGHYDRRRKLAVVPGDRNAEAIYKDVLKIVAQYYSSVSETMVDEPEVEFTLPTAAEAGDEPIETPPHVISLIGLSGIAEAAQQIIEKNSEAVFLAIESEGLNTEQVITEVKANAHTKFILLENYPSNTTQLVEFNSQVEGFSSAIIVDLSEDLAKERGVDAERIESFKASVLPLLYHIDNTHTLHEVDGSLEVSAIVEQIDSAVTTTLATPVPRMSTADPAALKSCRVIFVLGGPGSGKGTQCDLIVKQYGFTHLSTGDLLREAVQSGSPIGKQLKETMEKGDLVALETVLELLKDAMLKKVATTKGFLIDGYPRELEQGLKFEKDVAPVDCCISFEVPDDVMVKRLMKRGETSGRVDDNEETIKKRLATFHSVTQPVIDHYAKLNKSHVINAEGTIDEIFTKVQAVLK